MDRLDGRYAGPLMRHSLWSLVLAGTVLACGGDPSGPGTGNSSTTGNLTVTINGLPSGTDADVSVTGPNGYSQAVIATRTLVGLTPGTYVVSAQDVVATGGTLYSAAPSNQDVSVVGGSTAAAGVTYSPPSSGDLNLRIDGMYLTQSTQTYTSAVPLVENRNGYLRVFVVANRTNIASPAVRVRFYHALVLKHEVSIPAPALSVPTAVDESSLSYSWNIAVPDTLIRPGLSVVAEVDTDNTVAESDEGDNAFPAGAPLALNVRAVPPLGLTFVPILQSGLLGNVSDLEGLLDKTRRMYPMDGVDTIVHAQHYTVRTLKADGTGWVEVLGEIDAIRTTEGTSRYYYGVARVSYNSGVAGVAYVSDPSTGAKGRAALGWDYLPSGSEVVAHELGHNWGRNHAPCGDPAGLDPNYPYSGGTIGVYGLDVAARILKPPSFSDIMGYCDSKWISDYSYSAVLNYLSPPSLLVMTAPSQEVQPTLLVWGYIRDGQPVLEPAFQINTRPSLPRRTGSYSIEARAPDGSTLFALSFSPDRIADVPGNQQSFVFAVPVSAADAGRISTLRLAGQGRQTLARAAAPRGSAPVIERVPGGRVRLRWDAGANPMIMVRNAATGEVLSLARGGDVEISTSARRLELVLSDGVKSRREEVVLH